MNMVTGNMRIGCLVWNQFQVGHFAEIMKHFDEPDVIFTDRDTKGLIDFDADWLSQYGAYSRFIPEIELGSLDGQYDAILTQFTPPLRKPWKKTKLIMTQYSMAKPKTAYNARWKASDFGLVYGKYSDAIIRNSCPTSQMGNPRFDPFFEGRLDPYILSKIKSVLDTGRKTIAFLPTWGDLSSQAKFKEALSNLLPHYNVLYKPHHMTPLHDGTGSDTLGSGAIDVSSIIKTLDAGPYIMAVADVIVSDMSGIIFDALYCEKPVALLGLERNFENHKKAAPEALEVAYTDRIGPVVTDPAELLDHINILASAHPYKEINETLVMESFVQRGGCGPLAAESIRTFILGNKPRQQARSERVSVVKKSLLAKAYLAALRRRKNGDGATSENSISATATKKQRSTKMPVNIRSIISKIPLNILIIFSESSFIFRERWKDFLFSRRAIENEKTDLSTRWPSRDRGRFFVKKSGMKPYQHQRLFDQYQDQGSFLLVGREVECWSNMEPDVVGNGLNSFHKAAESVRFSRNQLWRLFTSLMKYAHSSRASDILKRNILREIDLFTKASNIGGRAPDTLFTTETFDHQTTQSKLDTPDN